VSLAYLNGGMPNLRFQIGSLLVSAFLFFLDDSFCWNKILRVLCRLGSKLGPDVGSKLGPDDHRPPRRLRVFSIAHQQGPLTLTAPHCSRRERRRLRKPEGQQVKAVTVVGPNVRELRRMGWAKRHFKLIIWAF